MVHLRKKSAWKYEGSESGQVQVDIVVAVGGGKGTITLRDPQGASIKFACASGGVGVGLGGKFSFGGDTNDAYSSGSIWMTNSFRGAELEVKDLVGVCMIVSASASVGLGRSWNYMLLGIPHPVERPGKFFEEVFWRLGELGSRVSNNAAYEWLQKNYPKLSPTNANAVLKVKGNTAGADFGAGVLGSFGMLWVEDASYYGDLSPKVTHAGPSRITVREDPLRISIPGDILFGFDRFIIKPSAYEDLHAAGHWMLKYKGRRTILIKGFTDSVGDGDYNISLSKKRADAVKQWLDSYGYTKGTSVKTRGLGESEPAASNTTPAGRTKNGRVEIIFGPFLANGVDLPSDPLAEIMAERYPPNHPGSIERVKKLELMFRVNGKPKELLARIESRKDDAALSFYTVLHPDTQRRLLKILRDRPPGANERR